MKRPAPERSGTGQENRLPCSQLGHYGRVRDEFWYWLSITRLRLEGVVGSRRTSAQAWLYLTHQLGLRAGSGELIPDIHLHAKDGAQQQTYRDVAWDRVRFFRGARNTSSSPECTKSRGFVYSSR